MNMKIKCLIYYISFKNYTKFVSIDKHNHELSEQILGQFRVHIIKHDQIQILKLFWQTSNQNFMVVVNGHNYLNTFIL